MQLKKVVSVIILAGTVSIANADVCKQSPGSVTCGKGTVSSLSGNGMVSVNGTIVEGSAIVNGMLTAIDANFGLLQVNGGVTLMQCTVKEDSEIKGSISASSSKFEKSLDIFSNSIRFINSKINNNLQLHHTENKNQEVYLDNNSEVAGNIAFDDGHGKVYVRGGSKIGGQVIGGEVINN